MEFVCFNSVLLLMRRGVRDGVRLSAEMRRDTPNLYQLVKLFLVMAVTTAINERSFSALKRLKTYMRSTMSEENLQLNAILHMYREMVDDLDREEISDEFIRQNERRPGVFGKAGKR
jgi:hypothetical protein